MNSQFTRNVAKVLMELRPVVSHRQTRMVMGVIEKIGPISVCDIANRLPIQQPEVSNALSDLSRAGLVRVEADGKSRIYSVNQDRVRLINRVCAELACTELVEI